MNKLKAVIASGAALAATACGPETGTNHTASIHEQTGTYQLTRGQLDRINAAAQIGTFGLRGLNERPAKQRMQETVHALATSDLLSSRQREWFRKNGNVDGPTRFTSLITENGSELAAETQFVYKSNEDHTTVVYQNPNAHALHAGDISAAGIRRFLDNPHTRVFKISESHTDPTHGTCADEIIFDGTSAVDSFHGQDRKCMPAPTANGFVDSLDIELRFS